MNPAPRTAATSTRPDPNNVERATRRLNEAAP